MGNVKTNIGNIDLSKISTTQEDAKKGNYLSEDKILEEYWTDLEVESMDDDTYLVTKDGEAMGWINKDGIQTESSQNISDSNMNEINESKNENINSNQNSEKQLEVMRDSVEKELQTMRNQGLGDGDFTYDSKKEQLNQIKTKLNNQNPFKYANPNGFQHQKMGNATEDMLNKIDSNQDLTDTEFKWLKDNKNSNAAVKEVYIKYGDYLMHNDYLKYLNLYGPQ